MLAEMSNSSNKNQSDLNNDLTQNAVLSECACFAVIDPNYPHSCQLCKRKISACLYTTELQHKITLQAIEINRLKDELNSSELEIRRQQSDLQALNTKYVAGIERVADVQSQKDQSDRELEELSARLFEEANNMVADEKRKRMRLEQLLYATKSQLKDERNQLRELKHRMQAISELPSTMSQQVIKYSADSVENTPTPNRKMIQVVPCTTKPPANLTFNDARQSQDITDLTLQRDKVDPDAHCLGISTQELGLLRENTFDPELNQLKIFRTYIDRYSNILLGRKRSSGSSTPSSFFDSEDEGLSLSSDDLFDYSYQQPPQQSAYIEQCEKEDIEPCLHFGNPNSRMCTKVMMQYMLQTPCFIEAITMEQAKLMPSATKAISSAYYRPIWERWTASVHEEDTMLLECTACGRKINTQQPHQLYRFRLDEQDDWLLVDPSCRNRLVAVCNFYSFARNIQFGHYLNQSFNELYLENVQLRKKIFESR
jgi:hypothetical protein